MRYWVVVSAAVRFALLFLGLSRIMADSDLTVTAVL